jgi:Zn-dependent peptidase ImmA (M78 family)
VNRSHPPNRQRFTIAHELGHHELHQGTFVNSTTRLNLRAEGHPANWREEAEANAFAAELLMPEEHVFGPAHHFVQCNPHTSEARLIEKLAADFQVSSQAMAIRLGVVGILTSPE